MDAYTNYMMLVTLSTVDVPRMQCVSSQSLLVLFGRVGCDLYVSPYEDACELIPITILFSFCILEVPDSIRVGSKTCHPARLLSGGRVLGDIGIDVDR